MEKEIEKVMNELRKLGCTHDSEAKLTGVCQICQKAVLLEVTNIPVKRKREMYVVGLCPLCNGNVMTMVIKWNKDESGMVSLIQ
jgi:hypothetical protein